MIGVLDYQLLARLLRQHTGLALGPGKDYLIQSRLHPVAAAHGLPDVSALLARLRASSDATLLREVCEAMATHESLFFRDGWPFELLREQILPELLLARRAQKRLRLWSAGASTGQEAYSIAMVLHDLAPRLAGWQVELLATDYSHSALARARAGVYNQFEVQRGLPPQLLARHFTPVGTDWKISDELRRRVSFRHANLLDAPAGLGTFDVIFCRNVLIYFDVPTKSEVLDRLAGVLAADGYLLLGSTETSLGLTRRLARAEGTAPAVFRAAAAAPPLLSVAL